MHVRYRSAAGRLTLLATIVGSGMAYLDSTAVNVALPALDRDLRAGFAGLQWILNGYLVALAALVLPGGSLGDRFGRRKIFLVGACWFAVASLLCGIAPTAAALIASRVLQGAGAALLVPASLAVLQSAFDPRDRARAIGAWSGFSGLTTIVGPLLGGWFADTVSWRLVFLINPALAVATVLLTIRWVPESRDRHRRNLDPAGAAAMAAGLSGISFAAIEGPALGWTSRPVLLVGALAIAGIAAFVAIERTVRDPMLPLRFFRRRQFTGVSLTTLLVYFALGGVMFLLTLQLQRVVGYSALAAGAALAPVTLLLLALSPTAGRLASRYGPRLFMTAGPLLAACGMAMMSKIQAGTTYVQGMLPAIGVFGAGLALTVAPLTAAAMAALDEEHAGLASGVSNALTRAAQLLAVSLLPLGAGLAGGGVDGPGFSHGFARAAWIGAAVMAAGGFVALVTVRAGFQSGNHSAGATV
jgi:EmrB/QacA subfamily drug resistance transporter